MKEIKKTYYEERVPELIEKLKSMISLNLELVDKDISGDLSEDKNHAVLKGRKMAAEDCVWAMKKIDELESELNGKEEEKTETRKSWSKRAAQKK